LNGFQWFDTHPDIHFRIAVTAGFLAAGGGEKHPRPPTLAAVLWQVLCLESVFQANRQSLAATPAGGDFRVKKFSVNRW